MKKQIDVLVHNIGQLCTIPAQDGGPQRGQHLGDLGLLDNAAVAIQNGEIAAVGPDAALREQYAAATTIDAGGTTSARIRRTNTIPSTIRHMAAAAGW